MNNEPLSESPSAIWYLFAAIMAVTAVLLTISGLNTAYTYNDASKVVGGDAYNFIIIAVRGACWIGAGIITAIFSAMFAVIGVLRGLPSHLAK
jgi:hypothetical protein